MIFSHSGDMGDIIYALPTIKALGGGDLTICEEPKSHHGMTLEKFHFLAPLIDSQPYIKNLNFAKRTFETPLNRFRLKAHLFKHGLTLVDVHLASYGLPPWNQGPWLECPLKSTKYRSASDYERIVISRTARYQNPQFPWEKIVKKYDCTFIGHIDEHRAFVKAFGGPSYFVVENALEAAILIKNCRLFIGNQSLFAAIATGLGVPMIQEVASADDWAHLTCLFEAQNRINGRVDNFELPEIL